MNVPEHLRYSTVTERFFIKPYLLTEIWESICILYISALLLKFSCLEELKIGDIKQMVSLGHFTKGSLLLMLFLFFICYCLCFRDYLC